jgi:hypothetical protein
MMKGVVLKRWTEPSDHFTIYDPPPLADRNAKRPHPVKVCFRGKAEMGREANSAKRVENYSFRTLRLCRTRLVSVCETVLN